MKKTLSLFMLSALFLSYGAMASANGNGFSISPSRGTSSRLLYEIKPGEKITDTIRITNNETVEKTFSIFAADKQASDAKSESFILKGQNEVQKEVGLWTKIGQNQLQLKGGESKNVEFTLEIPADTKKEITYEGGIVLAESSDKKAAVGGANSSNVSVLSQVGARLYVKVTDNPQLTDTTSAPKAEKTPDEATNSKSTGNIIIIATGLIIISILGIIITKKRK